MRTKSLAVTFLSGLVLLTIAACGSQPQTPEIVEISLTEFGIESTIRTFEVGRPYRFVITNTGALNHEFTIMPPMEMEGHDMGEMDMALLHVGEEQLTPGTTVTVEFTFTQPASLGVIEFACHLPAHYEAGMFTSISVNG